MDCPPIPPNCDPFQKTIGYFEWPVWVSDKLQLIRATNEKQRRIIAAVARCAWLDEAKRVYAEWKANAVNVRSGKNKEGCSARFSNFNDAFQAAYDSAEAWRAWGLKQ